MLRLADLRGAQQRTITHLYEHDHVQAVLPMGAGKTACALTAFSELKRDGERRHMFVLAPKRVALLVWPAEPRKWEHLQHLKVVVVTGTPVQRERALATPADVHVLGIDNAQWLVDWLVKQDPRSPWFDTLCIDELSRFKNPRGKRLRSLMKVIRNFRAIWGLTGTPRPNGYEDQFGPIRLLTNGKLWGNSFDRWRDRYFYPLDYNGYTWALHQELKPQLVKDINSVSITIPLEEMPDLPELNDGPEFIEWVNMPPEHVETYKRMKKHLVAQLRKEGKTVAAANMAVATGKLSQIVQGFLYDGEGSSRSAERIHDLKMERLLEMIEEADGEPVMVAYDFQEDLARLQLEFPGIPWLGKSDAADVEFERLWNERRIPVAAVHPASAGHGLNLQTGGSLLFWYGMTWSAELYDQLLKRLHRPGQTRAIFSRPILMRDTVDALKYERVRNKIAEQTLFQRLLTEV